ncbi:hypothetical protein [Haloplanus pelagicus]|jgi:hypothetical protein|uniref:hypothetical protein n=1 Tax=Haloplanus pelagicus TaxID=2949995 RepID=UPI00204246C4|nr:hypothetical protein [Haloplanus sp. HW8-1]
MPLSRRDLGVAVLSAVGLAGCATRSPSTGTASSAPTGRALLPPSTATDAFTHLRASGNRVVAGTGDVADAAPTVLDVDGRPTWLLAFGGMDSYWTVVTADGTAATHRVGSGTATRVADHGRVTVPPSGYRTDRVGLLTAPVDCAAHTHPVVTDDGLLYVSGNGDAVIRRDDGRTRLDVAAPSDARPIRVGDGRYALYGGRTDRYRHGALGDRIEGSELAVVDVSDERLVTTTTLDAPAVFEGLSPLAADVDGDGDDELVTTVADARSGARIRVYDAAGDELATGPVYGPGWRHQLCVAPFAPDGAPELAVVRKPHVDRTLEYYRLVDGELRVTATTEGYATHTYGSRNLDGGLAADLDADGRTELLVPTTDRRTLEAVRRTADGAAAAWSLSLGGSLATNVGGVALDDGGVAVGAGTPDGVRVWQG